MNQFKTVFGFTYREAIHKKSFIITTVILCVLAVGVCLLPRILGLDDSSEASATTDAQTVYYQDNLHLLKNGEGVLSAMGYRVTVVSEIESCVSEIAESGEAFLVSVAQGEAAPVVNFYARDFLNANTTALEAVHAALTNAWRAQTLSDLGVSEALLSCFETDLGFTLQTVGRTDVVNYVLGIVFCMLMYFAVYFYGIGVANSVATEKTGRVMETLVVSAKPRNILFGKCAAMGAAGLTQMGIFAAVAVAAYNLLIPTGGSVMGISLSLEGVSLYTGLVMLAYFLLGYCLYAMIAAVCGASVSRIEDTSNAMMPISLMGLISFYLGYFTALAGGGSSAVSAFALYFPFSSPFAMAFRLLNLSVSPAQVLLSLGIMLLSIAVVSVLSVKMYTAGVMHYGKRLNLPEMLKLKN